MSTPESALRHEVIALSPATPLLGSGSPWSIKRKRTPSAEASVSKKCFLVSPTGFVSPKSDTVNFNLSPSLAASKNIFPSGEAAIDGRSTLKTTHAHPEPEDEPEPELSKQLEHSRHVILPFNLRLHRGEFHERENRKLLWQLFDGIENITFDGRFLRFGMKDLPPKPWPRTVAGVPPYFTTDPADEGPIPPIKRSSRSLIKLGKDVDCRDDNSKIDEVFGLLKKYFIEVQIPITQLQYWGNFVVVVLQETDADLTKVPFSAATCTCLYLYDYELGRPTELPAQRQKEPSDTVVDDSSYDTLRPGVMLSSGKHPQKDVELKTTSGVLLKDDRQNRYLTVASHGFPFGTTVYHPTSAGKSIGEVIVELTHTDVALVKLHDNVCFENETFENLFQEAAPVRLNKFARAKDETMRYADPIFMNSPFTGYSTGIYGAYTEDRIPSDDPQEPEQVWIKAHWVYLGQGFSEQPADGAYGSAIWNADGDVLGFFRYAPRYGRFQDYCLSVAADHLVDRGYSIV